MHSGFMPEPKEPIVTNLPISNIASAALSNASGTSAAQPSAQAVSRFEQQLNAPAARAQVYESRVDDFAGTQGAWRSVMSEVGQISQQYRLDSASLNNTPIGEQMARRGRHGVGMAEAANVFQHNMSQVTHMSYTMLSISLVTSGERLVGDNVRSLFQLT